MNTLLKLSAVAIATLSLNAQAADITTFLNGGAPLNVPSINTYSGAHGASEFNSTFYDDFVFVVADSVANSSTTSVSFSTFFGLSNLSARLYAGSSHTTGATPTLVEAWSTPMTVDAFTTVNTVVLGARTLAAGTYTLQIRGTVTGAGGGGYSGLLNIVAIPESDTYAMLLAGLGVMGVVARRKLAA